MWVCRDWRELLLNRGRMRPPFPIALGTKEQSRTELSVQGTLTSSQACASLCCDHSGQRLPYKELYLWLPQAGSFSPDHLAVVPGAFPFYLCPREVLGRSLWREQLWSFLMSRGHAGRGWLGSLGTNRKLTSDMQFFSGPGMRGASSVSFGLML